MTTDDSKQAPNDSNAFSFKAAEGARQDQRYTESAVFASLKYNVQGLIPAIAQQYDSNEVLMMAWMNAQALKETLTTGQVCYWSRSRQQLWRKGESSGQIQHLKELRLDCDGDTLLLLVDQTGPACHTGRRNCFYLAYDSNQFKITTTPLIEPSQLYKRSN